MVKVFEREAQRERERETGEWARGGGHQANEPTNERERATYQRSINNVEGEWLNNQATRSPDA